VFKLVGCGEDFQVVESAAGWADEGALPLVEFVFGGFGAVLVDRFGPAAGDAGEEVGVVFRGGAGQCVFHPGGGVFGGVVPDAVQGQGDDGRGAGRDGPGGEGGSEFGAFGWLRVAGDPGPGQHRGGETDPAVGLGDTDPEPGAQELGSIPAPVISRGRQRRRNGLSSHSSLDSRGGEAGPAKRGGMGGAMRPRGVDFSVGFGKSFRAVVPACDPGLAAPGPAVPGPGGCRVGNSLGAGAVHGTGTEDLQILHGPAEVLDLAGKLGGLRVVGQCQEVRAGRCRRFHHGDSVRDAGGVSDCCRFSKRNAAGV